MLHVSGEFLLGMFSACATSMETLAVGSAFIDGGFANRVLATVSSHNATAERQFRYPTEYGDKTRNSKFHCYRCGIHIN